MAAATQPTIKKTFSKGLLVENPVLRLVLGTCPALAISTSVPNGIGMGIAATLVLIASNIMISTLRKVIPDKVRIPAYIIIIAGALSVSVNIMRLIDRLERPRRRRSRSAA